MEGYQHRHFPNYREKTYINGNYVHLAWNNTAFSLYFVGWDFLCQKSIVSGWKLNIATSFPNVAFNSLAQNRKTKHIRCYATKFWGEHLWQRIKLPFQKRLSEKHVEMKARFLAGWFLVYHYFQKIAESFNDWAADNFKRQRQMAKFENSFHMMSPTLVQKNIAKIMISQRFAKMRS